MFGLGRKYGFFVMVLGAAILLAPVPAFADGAFGGLITSGREIFTGLREIIYPASAVGIIAVCIGGFFGNINWKWLTAIILGLVVISLCAGFVSMFAPDGAESIAKDIALGN